jgi:hypothetical protein
VVAKCSGKHYTDYFGDPQPFNVPSYMITQAFFTDICKEAILDTYLFSSSYAANCTDAAMSLSEASYLMCDEGVECPNFCKKIMDVVNAKCHSDTIVAPGYGSAAQVVAASKVRMNTACKNEAGDRITLTKTPAAAQADDTTGVSRPGMATLAAVFVFVLPSAQL